MKITKLVILFNYKKILLGIVISIILFVLSFLIDSAFIKILFNIVGGLILLNIIASIVASYLLYDKSDLYEVNKLNEIVDFNNIENTVLIHASFDPLSQQLENNYPKLNLTVCDIYGNRHEHESGVEISKKVFPPNPNEIKINPTQLPFTDNSQDAILAITAIHEVLDHHKRVQFFEEAKRILKKDGVIILSEQFRNTTNFLFFNIGAFHFLSKKQWIKAITEADLKIVANKKVTPFANMLLIKKK
ncbi:methyltransferase domain-containing protein [Empedobacter sedimenti]|uniref:methyltransferase domain-containing protein n=1 Tax=Empedobacter sedimenti TaxID=3042610 RepID=UPI0024A6D86B|nr:methyltransferase domain-containing protein [Empedobacter sedimenti]